MVFKKTPFFQFFRIEPALALKGSIRILSQKKCSFPVLCGVLGERFTLGWNPHLTNKILVRMGSG
jgi:hypothetical protein